MSCYICSPDTFDYLATAATYWLDRYDFRQLPTDPEEIGTILYLQNVRSVQARYPNDRPEDLPGPVNRKPYTYRPVPVIALDPTTVIKSCDCLDYQSCETDDWDQTVAAKILHAIRQAAIRKLMPRYDAAPWGWERTA